MRNYILAVVTGASCALSPIGAEALPLKATGLELATKNLNFIKKAQYVLNGRRHCFYSTGWNGEGWYRCGYRWHRGEGWGGPRGYMGWQVLSEEDPGAQPQAAPRPKTKKSAPEQKKTTVAQANIRTSKEAVAAAVRSKMRSKTLVLLNSVIVGDYAIQSWQDDPMGGGALLKFDASKNQWVFIESDGGAWDANDLVRLGVPRQVASALTSEVYAPEKKRKPTATSQDLSLTRQAQHRGPDQSRDIFGIRLGMKKTDFPSPMSRLNFWPSNFLVGSYETRVCNHTRDGTEKVPLLAAVDPVFTDACLTIRLTGDHLGDLSQRVFAIELQGFPIKGLKFVENGIPILQNKFGHFVALNNSDGRVRIVWDVPNNQEVFRNAVPESRAYIDVSTGSMKAAMDRANVTTMIVADIYKRDFGGADAQGVHVNEYSRISTLLMDFATMNLNSFELRRQREVNQQKAKDVEAERTRSRRAPF